MKLTGGRRSRPVTAVRQARVAPQRHRREKLRSFKVVVMYILNSIHHILYKKKDVAVITLSDLI